MPLSLMDGHPLKPLALALCDLIRAACPELNQRIKWNAPSFGPGQDDRLTLNLSRPDVVRLILHRGAGAQDTRTGARLLPGAEGVAWQSDQRALVELRSLAELETRREELTRLCSDWVLASG